ncbi:hypothetical protein EJ02DRAFT_379657 [Clathrospora elynae]|uniref:F-box domain-containing protein n=1 Tax=Clathrospora elynae TaxID=706981 RepID=A0A6A5SIK1_9PLEO|nr:hypothetical protein EJ02DRAFT_379657 [Clathrospora elynae]
MDDLPNELILQIFNSLFVDGCHDIWNLSRVDRRFNRLANDLTYNRYSCERGDPRLLIRTLASSKSLANCVKLVQWNFDHDGDALKSIRTLTPAECRQVEGKLVQLQSSPGEEGTNSQTFSLEGRLALGTLLLFTPRIETLVVMMPSHGKEQESWIKPLVLHSRLFANLSRVVICGPLRIRDVLPLFTMPPLRHVDLSYVTIDRNRHQNWKDINEGVFHQLDQEGSSVEHFVVTQCYTDMVDILRLLKSFRGLKTFHFEHVEGGQRNDEVVDVQTLLNGLLYQRNFLECLHLRDCRKVDLSVLEVLKELEHLRYLNLDATNFFADYEDLTDPQLLSAFMRHLPNNLLKLSLQANDNIEGDGDAPSAPLGDALKAVAPTVRTLFPVLKELAIVGWDPLQGNFPCQTQLKLLQRAYAKSDVRFVSCPEPSAHEDNLHGLDNVEEGWVWIQAISEDEGKWMRSIEGGWVNYRNVVCDDEEEDWVNISIINFDWPGYPGDAVVDEYSVEQPLWYWEKLCSRN